MSLRRRLLVVVVLAAVALAAAGLAIFHVVTGTDAARRRATEAALNETTAELAEAFRAMHADSLAAAPREDLERAVNVARRSIRDGSAGFCTRDGELISEGAGHPGPGPGKHLPPDQREGVVAACRAAGTMTSIAHPHDTVFVSARMIAPDGAAWALRRVPIAESAEESTWKIDLAMLSTATLALVAVTLSVAFALGGGVRQLEGSLTALETDLLAPLEEPKAEELARLTAGLRKMASQIASARDRERGLQRDLAHRDRLTALGRIVAGLAHEIRNPLAGVKLKLDVLARAPTTSDGTRDSISSCLDEIARLDRVVQSMLVVARKSTRKPEPVALAVIVDERAALLANAATASGVTFRTKGDAFAVADRDELARAIDNLLRNALEASPADSEVLVSIEDDGAAAHVRIADRGPGVPADRAGELFEPFFTSKPEGTGLGLWLSRALVEAHGGTLAYQREGDTTVFEMTLPHAPVPA